jgi:hypothetical protein
MPSLAGSPFGRSRHGTPHSSQRRARSRSRAACAASSLSPSPLDLGYQTLEHSFCETGDSSAESPQQRDPLRLEPGVTRTGAAPAARPPLLRLPERALRALLRALPSRDLARLGATCRSAPAGLIYSAYLSHSSVYRLPTCPIDAVSAGSCDASAGRRSCGAAWCWRARRGWTRTGRSAPSSGGWSGATGRAGAAPGPSPGSCSGAAPGEATAPVQSIEAPSPRLRFSCRRRGMCNGSAQE